MKWEFVLLISSLTFIFIAQASGAGCGSNWLGGDLVGSDTVTPVGYDRPWLEKPEPSPLKQIPAGKDNSDGDVTASETDLGADQTSGNMTSGNTTSGNTTSGNTTSSNMTGEGEGEVSSDKGLDVTGRWSIELAEARVNLDLILYQAGSMVYGNGDLMEENVTVPVTTRGSMDEANLRLDVISAVDGVLYTESNLYRLALTMENETLQGSYESVKDAFSGNATGIMMV